MINLKKMILEIQEENEKIYASTDDETEWKWHQLEYLQTMGFQTEGMGDRVLFISNPPIRVYKKKKGNFVVEEPSENYEEVDFDEAFENPKLTGSEAFEKSKQIQRNEFTEFKQMVEFFDKYKQDSTEI